jgi:hypothetical protein
MPNSHDLPPAETIPLSILAWSRHLLGDPDLTPQDNFIDAGGHSLLAVRLGDLIATHYEAELDMATLFDHDLETVAADIERKQSSQDLSA